MVFASDLMNKRRDSNRKICAFVFYGQFIAFFIGRSFV
jgi:hypothetical protein